MPLKPIPDHGLELPLGEYSKLKAFQGGGWYWDHHHQQTICQTLGEFLPRVEERDGGALFQHFVHGRETAAKSRPVAAGGDRVPKGELQRLQRALETLKRKADDPGTDRDAKRIIESFALPDPAKDPELYRLHGPPWRRRLLVLWGCEREAGSSVTPFAALGRVPVEPTSTTWLRRWPLLLGALLLLLLLLLLADMFWQNRDRDQPTGGAPQPGLPWGYRATNLGPARGHDQRGRPTAHLAHVRAHRAGWTAPDRGVADRRRCRHLPGWPIARRRCLVRTARGQRPHRHARRGTPTPNHGPATRPAWHCRHQPRRLWRDPTRIPLW